MVAEAEVIGMGKAALEWLALPVGKLQMQRRQHSLVMLVLAQMRQVSLV